jgi:hypothetical protein
LNLYRLDRILGSSARFARHFFAGEQMSNPSATGAASSTVRRSLQAIANWRGRADRAYSPVFSIALLLVVGFAVKLSH